MNAKVGEYYKHKWNKYVARVTKVSLRCVDLIVINSGVHDVIAIENFDLNYEPCTTIFKWLKKIEELYMCEEVLTFMDAIRCKDGNTVIDFSVNDDMLVVCFTDDVKEILEADSNVMRFLLEDADEVIEMFADFFEE